MIEEEAEKGPDGQSMGLANYLVWIGNQLTATAVGAYAATGVGFLEARIIFALGTSPHQPAARLARHLGVDRAAICRALQQLRAAGLIVTDAQRRISLSPAGWAKQAQVACISDQRRAQLTLGLAEGELAQLLHMLQRLQKNMPRLRAPALQKRNRAVRDQRAALPDTRHRP